MPHHDAVFGVGITMRIVLLAFVGSVVLGGPVDGGPSGSAAAPAAVILNQPDLPRQGAPSDPGRLATILQDAGWNCRLFSASELADSSRLNAARASLVVLPYGPVVPVEARESLLAHLQRGGSLITTGGYAFNEQVRRVDGRWVREETRLAEFRRAATAPDRSLLPDGRLESSTPLEVGGFSLDGRLRISGPNCRISREAHDGQQALRCALPAEGPDSGASAWADLPATPGRAYEVSAWVKTEKIVGRGIAFVAMYQYDAEGKLVTFRDFAAVRGTTPWTRYTFQFEPAPRVKRLHLSLGLYEARGTIWVDDLRLCDVTGLAYRPMNTATGTPRDGLETAPLALGMFDADYPLKRVTGARSAAGQSIVPAGLRIESPLSGWAASGTIGNDQARWIPLLETHDRYGRSRGPLAALLVHYNGPFRGSCWAYFGADNVDLLAEPGGPGERAFAGIARFLRHHCFLHNLATEHRLLRAGEPLQARVKVDDRGPSTWRGEVAFTLEPMSPAGSSPHREPATIHREVTLEPGTSQELRVEFPPLPEHSDLWRLTAQLTSGGAPIDEMTTGVVRENPSIRFLAPPLRFRDNYFTLGGRPLFLFGSDSYAESYNAACENPLTWAHELETARDFGVQLYENLQYNNPDESLTDADWRSFAALDQQVQRVRLVFMPGVLIGHNVAIGDERLARESRLCEEYARRFATSPSLLWYLNGDYVLDPSRHASDVRALWNRWLKTAYRDRAHWASTWGNSAAGLTWGDLDFPPVDSGRWADAAAVDRATFLEWLTRRWNASHAAAVRRHDSAHALTSEYYSIPMGCIDLPRTIDGQDVSNIGFFGPPGTDIDNLPGRLAFNDARLRGKGVSLGEYGVKTHPAWSAANGGQDYHLVRTPEEQRRLFMDVAHFALGMGACKVQNWCLLDDPTRVFPWGLFYPNEMVPKDIAFAHRNQSFLWRFFAPVFQPAPVAVCLANQLRRGNNEGLGMAVASRAFGDLIALSQPFNTVDDDHLDVLPAQTRVIFLPSPLTLADRACSTLLAWARGGGVLFLSGDLCRDEHRRPLKPERLRELAGLERLAERYPPYDRSQGSPVDVDLGPLGLGRHPLRPCLRVKPISAEVLARAADGAPVMVRNSLGKGLVYFLADPIEQSDDGADRILRRQLYEFVLKDAGRRTGTPIKPLFVEPHDSRIFALRQPTARGAVFVVANNRPTGGTTDVTLRSGTTTVIIRTADSWPALLHLAHDGRILAASTTGEVRVDRETLTMGRGLHALLALDRADLRRSEAIVLAPFEPGKRVLPARGGPWTVLIGDFHGGAWRTYETIAIKDGPAAVSLDADRATCLVLFCRPGQEASWTQVMERALTHPDELPTE
ncbi:MAG: hypothetical protein ACP5XB_18925 [Isosphaeraceae bacterium]